MDLHTESEIPWTITANLGDGIAAPSGELLQSAVEPFTTVPGETRSEKLYTLTVKSEKEIRKLVSADAHVGFNTAAVATSAQTHVENNLSVSDRSSTIVFKGRFVWDQALTSPLPRLTAEARSLYERDPSEFHRAHGHYFIAGFTKEAELTIFARVIATSRESVRKISAKVEAAIHSVGWKADAGAATDIENLARSQNCKIELDLLKIGMSDDKDSDVPGLTLSEIPGHVKDFQKRAVGSKTTALLVHYTRVEPKISTKTDVSAEMYEKANHFYENLVVARVLRSRLPKYYAKHNMEKLLKDIEDDALKYVPRDLSGNISKLYDLSDRIENWLSDVEKLEAYRRLWHDVKATPGTKNGFKWGVTLWDDPELSGLEIDSKSESLRLPYTTPGWRNGHLKIEVPHRKICGIELKSNKEHAGSHNLKNGGLNKDFVKFDFKSEYDRGFNWTVKVWSIPEGMAHFASDEL
jgi:hypothetical protein